MDKAFIAPDGRGIGTRYGVIFISRPDSGVGSGVGSRYGKVAWYGSETGFGNSFHGVERPFSDPVTEADSGD